MMKKIILGLCILALSCASGAYAAEQEPIRVGLCVSLSGGAAAYGIHMRNGAQDAADDINKAGGIQGRKLELVVEDDAGNPAQASSVLIRMISQHKVNAIIGGANSTLAFVCKEIAEAQHVPTITTSGSNPKLTGPDNKYFFRLHQSDEIAATRAARFFVEKLGLKKIGVLSDTSDFGMGCRDYFVKALEDLGVKPVTIQSFNVGDLDFTPQLLEIKQAGAEGLGLFANLPEASFITRQSRQLGLSSDKFQIIMTGIAVPRYIELAPGDTDNVYGVGPFVATMKEPEAVEYVERYRKEYNMDPSHHSTNTYQAIVALAKAWEKVGTKDNAAVADALKTVQWDAFGQKGNHFLSNGQGVLTIYIFQVQDGVWRTSAVQVQ
ncbi:MAG: ABC transporter substrate-binding protein [Synergistaceae bacterium]|jgi:branched-chain amino acid transport system substrate-binding protein|nr:ABC transporter substrate-binding protein [Synergistaceae bacterium]